MAMSILILFVVLIQLPKNGGKKLACTMQDVTSAFVLKAN